jgi:hypothetical protein
VLVPRKDQDEGTDGSQSGQAGGARHLQTAESNVE